MVDHSVGRGCFMPRHVERAGWRTNTKVDKPDGRVGVTYEAAARRQGP